MGITREEIEGVISTMLSENAPNQLDSKVDSVCKAAVRAALTDLDCRVWDLTIRKQSNAKAA